MNRGLYGAPRGRRKKLTNLKFIGCRVRLEGTTSLPNTTGTPIVWDTLEYDFGGCLNLLATPTRLTAPIEGWYEFQANVHMPEAFPSSARVFVDLAYGTPFGGSQIRLLARRDIGAFRHRVNVCAVTFLRAREFVEVVAWQSFGSTKTVGGASAGNETVCCATMARRG